MRHEVQARAVCTGHLSSSYPRGCYELSVGEAPRGLRPGNVLERNLHRALDW